MAPVKTPTSTNARMLITLGPLFFLYSYSKGYLRSWPQAENTGSQLGPIKASSSFAKLQQIFLVVPGTYWSALEGTEVISALALVGVVAGFKSLSHQVNYIISGGAKSFSSPKCSLRGPQSPKKVYIPERPRISGGRCRN
eukprot:sb/3474301/